MQRWVYESQRGGGVLAAVAVKEYKWIKSRASPERIAELFADSHPDPEDDPYRILFKGPCPDCEHQMVWQYPLVAVRGGEDLDQDQLEVMRDAARSAGLALRVDTDVTMICSCMQPHAERPNDAPREGCGRYWNIHVEWP